ncbi:Fumagillin beta-trans-bergamotene synthase [Colletotrichum sp. SAR 10_70]|nr:Fumagillin beta-trans-bergamotene synthase [Colletotrichum sp. SAR 10_70]
MSQPGIGEHSPLTFKRAAFEDDAAPSKSSSSSSSATSTVKALLSVPRLIWDFTESNFSTFVAPNTAFGLLGGLTGSPLTSGQATALAVLQRFPLVVAFNWYSVLIFDLANQRGSESVAEDRANKPWRPIPAGKVTQEQTRAAMLVAIPAVLVFNYVLGVWSEGVFILILTWLYNDLRGGDTLARDAIIAVAYFLFNTASLKIAIGDVAAAAASASEGGNSITREGYLWAGIISAVILTTMQVQDLKDQAGDAGRGRNTIPLFFGDFASRASLAVLVPAWSCVCVYFWGIRSWGVLLPVVSGALVVVGVLRTRTPETDARAWRLWCLWTVCLYSLPLFGGAVGGGGDGFVSLEHV